MAEHNTPLSVKSSRTAVSNLAASGLTWLSELIPQWHEPHFQYSVVVTTPDSADTTLSPHWGKFYGSVLF